MDTGPIISEYSLILLFSVLGATFLITSTDLLSMYLSLELQSFSVYLLSSIHRESVSSTSAGLKYFLLGSLSSCLIVRLLFSLRYGSLRSKYCPIVFPATGLGKREILELNIAFLHKDKTGQNRICLVACRADSPMNKAILLKSHLPGAST